MSNPLLNPDKFQPPGYVPPAYDNVPGSPWPPPPPAQPQGTLRRAGVASATGVLLAIVTCFAAIGWQAVTVERGLGTNSAGQTVEVVSASVPPWVWILSLVSFGIVIATFFRPAWARFTAPLYAMGQGVFVGAISHVYDAQYDGIVLQAVGLTIGVFAVMLGLYATGVIRVTPRLRLGIIAATGGVCLIYLATIVMHLFGGTMPFIHDAGPIGIGFSLVVVTLAAMNLTLDFDFIDRAEQAGAPRNLEWFAALGLLVTLIWLYLELLRLLAKLNRR